MAEAAPAPTSQWQDLTVLPTPPHFFQLTHHMDANSGADPAEQLGQRWASLAMAGNEWFGKPLSQPSSHINRNPWMNGPHHSPEETLLLQAVIWLGRTLLQPKSSSPSASQRCAWRSSQHAAAAPRAGAHRPACVATPPCTRGRITLQQHTEARTCHELQSAPICST